MAIERGGTKSSVEFCPDGYKWVTIAWRILVSVVCTTIGFFSCTCNDVFMVPVSTVPVGAAGLLSGAWARTSCSEWRLCDAAVRKRREASTRLSSDASGREIYATDEDERRADDDDTSRGERTAGSCAPSAGLDTQNRSKASSWRTERSGQSTEIERRIVVVDRVGETG